MASFLDLSNPGWYLRRRTWTGIETQKRSYVFKVCTLIKGLLSFVGGRVSRGTRGDFDRSACLLVHLQLLFQFNLTALHQIQSYNLKTEASLCLSLAHFGLIDPTSRSFPSAPATPLYHHPRSHKRPTTQVIQATTINAKPL